MEDFMARVAPGRLEILLNDEVLESIAAESNGEKRKIISHRVTPLRARDSDEVKHYSLTINVVLRNRPHDTKDLKFFVKMVVMKDGLADIPECSSTRREIVFLPQPRVDELFRDDVYYYSNVQPLLQTKYFGFPWSPRCQLSTARVLILQDMSAMGYVSCSAHRNASKFKTGSCFDLDENQVYATLTSLANLHAASILAETDLGKPLNEVCPYAFREKVFKAGSALQSGFKVIERMVERFGLKSGLCDGIFKRICKLVVPKKDHYNVVCHGAPYGANLLFDTRPGCLLVDYSYARYAPACLDVALFIYMHTTTLFRVEAEIDLVAHYAKCLQQTLQQSAALEDVAVDTLPTPENVVDTYHRYKLAGMARACYEFLIEPLVEDVAGGDFALYLEACRLRLGADSDAENLAKDMLIELIEEAERTLCD